MADSKVTHATNKESHLGTMTTNFQMSLMSRNAKIRSFSRLKTRSSMLPVVFTHDVEHCRDRSERPCETMF
jgi:hypothetical protein